MLPFDQRGMLTTGTVGDVVGRGLPALISDWPFLKEVLGHAAICYGSTADQLRECLEALTPARLTEAASRTRELRSAYDPAAVGQRLMGLVRTVAVTAPRRLSIR